MIVKAIRELRREAGTWALAPSRPAQARALELEAAADELAATLRRGAIS